MPRKQRMPADEKPLLLMHGESEFIRANKKSGADFSGYPGQVYYVCANAVFNRFK